MGASALAAMLHAGALLLKLITTWDWFITLSTADYPLFTQDGKVNAMPFQLIIKLFSLFFFHSKVQCYSILQAEHDIFVVIRKSPLFCADILYALNILYALKFLPRDLNFVHYTNSTAWKK